LTLAPDGKPLRHERERSRKQRRRDLHPRTVSEQRKRSQVGTSPQRPTARNMTDAKAAAVISWRASCPHVSK
jgi:hypothetical protein